MSGSQIDNQLIADLARDVIVQAAPQEVPLFRANSEAYFKDPQKALQPRGGKDEMLGFGDGGLITFLTPAVLMVTTEVVKFLAEEVKKSLKTEGTGVVNEVVKGLFKKFRPQGAAPKDDRVPPLTPAQLAQVRKLALEKAHQLKLSDDKAALLADSILGSLAASSS
jgi:hypothetical protein